MIEAGVIRFRDLADGEEAIVDVRYDSERVALCVSLQHDGDAEVIMTHDQARNLLILLQRALE
jgi:hypothetical protein